MHILLLSRKYPPSHGGMETFSYELGRHLPSPKTIIAYGRKNRDVWWVVPVILFRALFQPSRIDAIIITDGVLMLIAPFLRVRFRCPIIATIHGLELTYAKKHTAFNRLFYWSSSFVTHFVAVSHATRDRLHSNNISLQNISVISHGIIPSSHYDRILARQAIQKQYYLPITDTTPLIIFVGRLIRRKGATWFVRNVMPKLQHHHCVLCIASDGPERLIIQAAIYAQHMEQSIFLLGNVSLEQLSLLYHAADFFVMPNIPVEGDMEGFGIVALEAAASECMVIASRLEGIPDAVHDGRNGILVSSGNTDEFVQTLEYWITHSSERKIFAKNAREYTLEHFQWQHAASAYEHLCKTLQQHS